MISDNHLYITGFNTYCVGVYFEINYLMYFEFWLLASYNIALDYNKIIGTPNKFSINTS